MEIIKPSILLIGENLYSIFLTTLLKRKKIASLILSPNQSAMLHNPIFKSYNNNTPTFEDNSSTIIQEFLSQLSIFTLEKFEPFKALCCNGTIINCSAIYEQYNYYEEYKKSGKDIAFINLENMEGVDRPSVESVSGFALFNLRVLDKGRVYPAHELAYILENNIEGLKDLSAEIKKNISPRAYNIVLPPILGVSTSDKIIAFITESTGCKVFEAITFNNSIISNRFYHILKRYIEREGLKVIYDKIRKINKENDIITTITTDNFEICPEVVVLISERFVEEGLTIRENRVVEPIFNLPVFFNNSKNDISYFTEENIWGKHNIFSCGIKTDENFMPIDIYGDTVYKNLYSIGSIIINNLDPLKNLFDVFKLYTILRKRFNK